jgi:ribosomal protein L11 methyltransferase
MVSRVLFDLGSQGVHEDGNYLVTWFPEPVRPFEVEGALRAAGFTGEAQYSSSDPVDWAEHWKDALKAHQVGGVFVCPPWLQRADQPGSRTVVIDPGMAFGTGDHASTRCALLLLQRFVAPGSSVADLGAGSAVLAIAAARCGARHVVAVERDSDAIANAVENVRLNGVGNAVLVMEGSAEMMLPLVAPFDTIVANIISSVLLSILSRIGESLSDGGTVILSGIMDEERQDFSAVLEERNWSIVDEYCEESWCALAVRPR